MNYYNENDPGAAAWLLELIADNLIAPGIVDTRSIIEIQPNDLSDFVQCHFFAGIGGWSYALRLAGWPDDKPVWTGSCPCQPFSVAGKGLGIADARHLWPEFFRLIKERKPSAIFGEQVASAAGRDWLSRIRIDLEGMGYEVGAADLCAAGIGAPHIRQRLFWMAQPESNRREQRGAECERQIGAPSLILSGGTIGLDNGTGQRFDWRATSSGPRGRREFESGSSNGRLAKSEQQRERWGNQHGLENLGRREICQSENRPSDSNIVSDPCPATGRLDNAAKPGSQGLNRHGDDGDKPGWNGTDAPGHVTEARCLGSGGMGKSYSARPQPWSEASEAVGYGHTFEPTSFWHDAIWHACLDGKNRRISSESEIFPLAHGLPGRVGLLRGSGNAIVPELAALFIQAAIDLK